MPNNFGGVVQRLGVVGVAFRAACCKTAGIWWQVCVLFTFWSAFSFNEESCENGGRYLYIWALFANSAVTVVISFVCTAAFVIAVRPSSLEKLGHAGTSIEASVCAPSLPIPGMRTSFIIRSIDSISSLPPQRLLLYGPATQALQIEEG